MKFLKPAIVLTCLFSIQSFANVGIIPPEQNNSAYILMEYDTGEILAQKNANTPLPPASLTKMMTSYLVEQRLLNGTLSESTPITVSERAWCRGSSTQSCMYVPVNTSATAIDMLRGVIVQSGNDASAAFAEHISGSESAFAVLMNEEAQKLGMTNTHFVNATGMPHDEHLSTAKDLALLSRAIIQNSGDYYKIYSEKSFTYNNITQDNRNTLITTDPTVDGLKTGHTAQAGYCLAVSSHRDNMRLIAIVLGAPSMQARADQARELLAFGYGHFENTIKASQGQSVSNAPIRYGKADNVELITAAPLKVLTTKNQASKITTVTEINPDIKAPITEGQELGRMIAMLDGQAVASTPLVAKVAVEQANIFSRMWQSTVDWFKNLF